VGWKISMKYKAIIFDLFGTLVDNFTRTDYDSVMAEIASILNAPQEDFLKLWKSSFNERVTGIYGDPRESFTQICRQLQIKVSPWQIDLAFNIRMDFSRRTTIPREGSVEVLTTLRKDGYKVGLISDCTGEIPLIWDETPFANLFDVKIFSCAVKTKKPDPRIYYMATDQLKVKPADCLYIGDGSSNELTGASKIGMHPVRIRDPHEPAEDQYMEREDDWAGPKISYLKEVLEFV
jgi:putative hydrolase of the HAD superfamily